MKNSVRIKRDNLILLVMYFSSIFFICCKFNSACDSVQSSKDMKHAALILQSLHALGLFLKFSILRCGHFPFHRFNQPTSNSTVKVIANMHRYACIFKSNFQCWMILIGDKLNNCIQRS